VERPEDTLDNAIPCGYNDTMTLPSEILHAPKRVIAPCRLIFWGIIICIIDFRLNGFDIINDFVGMIMILWGVVSLSRVPISAQYQRWMAFPVILVILSTIGTFFTEILLVQIHPNEFVSAMLFLYGIISILGVIVFCRCMREYCSVMNWERVVASWKYSTRLITYCILLPYIILSVPLYLFIASLTFIPKQPQPPNGFAFNFAGSTASIDASTAMIVVPLILLVAVVVIWVVVHFLISLSRTIRAARFPSLQPQNTAQKGTNRVVFLSFFVIAMLFVLVGSALMLSVTSRMEWNRENFSFNSGPTVYVFQQPKLVVFLGDGGDEEIFDRIGSAGSSTSSFPTGFGHGGTGFHRSGDVEVSASSSGNGKITMWFLDRTHEMVFSERGTKLTLADGRTFTLDGKTPLWLRCMSDGTVIELDELPEGFIEFFESPPDNPGLIQSVRSYPDAFRK
jgi:hypothetical protein